MMCIYTWNQITIVFNLSREIINRTYVVIIVNRNNSNIIGKYYWYNDARTIHTVACCSFDCGMWQGRVKTVRRTIVIIAFNAQKVATCIQTHTHTHIGGIYSWIMKYFKLILINWYLSGFFYLFLTILRFVYYCMFSIWKSDEKITFKSARKFKVNRNTFINYE